MPRLPPALLLSIALSVAGALTACGAAEGVASTTARFDAAGNRVPSAHDGTGTPLALPADFPADVALPAHYAIDAMTEMPGVRILSLLAEGEVGALSHSTRVVMERAGWQRRLATRHVGGSAVLAFEKDRRSALFSFDHNAPVPSPERAGVIVSVQLQDPDRML